MSEEIHGPTVPDEESLAFEALVVATVTGVLAAQLDALSKTILEVFLRFSTLGRFLDIGKSVADSINAVRWTPMEPKLLQAGRMARDLGQKRAIERLGNPEIPRRTHWPVDVPDIDRATRDGLQEAATIARGGVRTRHTASAVAGKVRSTRARMQGTARYVANEGINAGTAEVARVMNLRLLWVAERNACLHCLAHAGYAVNVGEEFPVLSFDPRGSKLPGVPYPPLHPNCRCQVRTYDGEAGPPDTNRTSLDPADRLAAEARRSVVYQWTDHASGPAARRAADALLSAGAALPSSVEKRARAAIKKGGVARPTKRRQK